MDARTFPCLGKEQERSLGPYGTRTTLPFSSSGSPHGSPGPGVTKALHLLASLRPTTLTVSLSTRVAFPSVSPNVFVYIQPGEFIDHQHPRDGPRWAPHHHPATTDDNCVFQGRRVSTHHFCVELFICSFHTCVPYRLGYLRKRLHIPCRPNERHHPRHGHQRCLGRFCLAGEQPEQSTCPGHIYPRNFR